MSTLRRRDFLCATGVTAATALSAGCSAIRGLTGPPPAPDPVAIPDDTWSQWDHDQRNSRSTGQALLGGSEPLGERWRFSVTDRRGGRVVTDAAHVYLVAKGRDRAEGQDRAEERYRELVALDHETGVVQWRRSAPALVEADGDRAGLYPDPVAAAVDTVFAVATGPGSATVVAVESATGAVRWRLPAEDVSDVVAERGGSLLVAERFRSRDRGRVRRVDLRTGEVLWEYRTPPGDEGSRVLKRVAVDGDAVYVPVSFSSDRGEIHVLDKRTGAVRTTIPLETWVYRGLVVHDGLLVGAFRDHPEEHNALFAVDPDSGAVEWLLPTELPARGIAAAGGHVVYSRGSTSVVDPETGKRVRSADGVAGDAPLVAGSRFLTNDGRTLYGHEVESGERISVYDFDAETELDATTASQGTLLLSARQEGRGWAVVALGR